MATLVRDAHSKQYHIRFRFAGRSFKRSLKTNREAHAAASLARLTETISLVRRGVLELPPDADAVTFLLSGGRTRYVRPSEPSITLGQLFTKYQANLPEQAKEATTLKTEEIHIKPLHGIRDRDATLKTPHAARTLSLPKSLTCEPCWTVIGGAASPM